MADILPDWEMEDLRAFVDLVADEDTKKLLKDIANDFAFPEADKLLFSDTIKAVYTVGYIMGLQVMDEMYQNDQFIEILKSNSTAELIDLVKRFKQSQHPGREMH
jgi:hypothetical protein